MTDHELEPFLAAVEQTLMSGSRDAADRTLDDLKRPARLLADRGNRQQVDGTCPQVVRDLLAAVAIEELDECDRTFMFELRRVAPRLRWLSPYLDYDEADIVELRSAYYFTTIVGPSGDRPAVVHSDEVSVFLSVQGPDLFYPSHVHKAPEFYRTLAGTGEWQKGGGPFELKPPGCWISHPSGTRHAMRSLDTPIVAMAIWTADLDSGPVIVRD